MNGKLPLNWNLQHKGIQLAFRCVCCQFSNVESIDCNSSLLRLKINEWWLSLFSLSQLKRQSYPSFLYAFVGKFGAAGTNTDLKRQSVMLIG